MDPITNDEELAAAACDAGALLQRIQDFLGREPDPEGRVRFPRGYLSTAADGRRRLRFTMGEVLRTNVAYALMLADVPRWILHRTNLAATGQEMVVKIGLAIYGAVAETALREFTSDVMGKRQPFASRAELLVERRVIDANLRDELAWLWDRRNRQHLYELADREIEHYMPKDLDRAERAVAAVIERLAASPQPAAGAQVVLRNER